MYVIGVCGKTGCGKSLFSSYLEDFFCKSKKKAICIDIHLLSQSIIKYNEEVREKIKKSFGDKILEDGEISIKNLNDFVFTHKIGLNLLNRITLPAMCKELDEIILSHNEYDYIILDYALLPRIEKYFNLCNYKILLKSSLNNRKRRIIHRDNITEDKFLKREDYNVNYQKDDFDIVIENNEKDKPNIKDKANHMAFYLNEINSHKNIAYYPGSFDPITYGHMDIVNKVLAIGFDEIIIAVTKNNSKKSPMFSLQERYEMIKELYKFNSKVTVVLVDSKIASATMAKKYNCKAIIRGLRNVTDFEYELDLSKVNSTISTVETVFLTASHKYDFVSSSTTRELANLGEDISFYVPPVIKDKVLNKNK